MYNWGMLLAKLEPAWKEKVGMKYHQETTGTLNICDPPKNFFGAGNKENLRMWTYQRKPKC